MKTTNALIAVLAFLGILYVNTTIAMSKTDRLIHTYTDKNGETIHITESMIDDYLYQLYDKQDKTQIVRYEEMEIKASFAHAKLTEQERNLYHQYFRQNLALYQQWTSTKITEIPSGPSKENITFAMVVANMPIYEIVQHKPYWQFFIGNRSRSEARDIIGKLKDNPPLVTSRIFTRDMNRSIFFGVFLIDGSHVELDKDKNQKIIDLADTLFFEIFTHTVHNIHQLPSIMTAEHTDLLPLDIAYIQALYAPNIESGMDIKTAKPLLKFHMIRRLTQP